MQLLLQLTAVTSILGSALASMQITAGGQANHQYENGKGQDPNTLQNYPRVPRYPKDPSQSGWYPITPEKQQKWPGWYPSKPQKYPSKPGNPDETPKQPEQKPYQPQNPDQKPTTGPTDKPLTSYDRVDCKQMLGKVNEFRSKNGKGPLQLADQLTKASQLHSDDQARSKKMSHTGSNGSSMSSRIDAQGYKWSGLAENVAWNQKSIDQVMNSWINSPGHRANLLGNYVHFGCGFNNFYWTQNFASPMGSYNPGNSPSQPIYPSKPAKPVESPVTPPKQPEKPVTTPVVPPKQPEQKPHQPENPATGPTDKPLTSYDRVDCNQMLGKVNEFRSKNGKGPLKLADQLTKASQLHSDDQAKTKKMSHTGSNGSSMSSRIDAQGYKWSGLAENVAWNQKSIDQVMNSWINSPGHRANLLGNYVHFGCGFNNFYWTQNFASPMGSYKA